MPASMEKPSAPPLADLEKLDPEKAPIAAVKDEEDEEYPALPKLILIMTAVYLSMFLVALVGLTVKDFLLSQLTATGPNYTWGRHSEDHR